MDWYKKQNCNFGSHPWCLNYSPPLNISLTLFVWIVMWLVLLESNPSIHRVCSWTTLSMNGLKIAWRPVIFFVIKCLDHLVCMMRSLAVDQDTSFVAVLIFSSVSAFIKVLFSSIYRQTILFQQLNCCSVMFDYACSQAHLSFYRG